MFNFEGIAANMFKTLMDNPIIRQQVEDLVKHVLDIHQRLVLIGESQIRIEQKLDAILNGDTKHEQLSDHRCNGQFGDAFPSGD